VTASRSTVQCHHRRRRHQLQPRQQHFSDRPSATAKVASTHGGTTGFVGRKIGFTKHESEGRDEVDGVIRHRTAGPGRAGACREGVSWRQMDEKIV